MTDLIVKDLQKQDPGSELIELFELELDSSTTVYFHSGVEENLNAIQFRDDSGTLRTYTAIPLQAQGFKNDPSGTSARPTISFANVSNTFKNSITNYENLLGAKLTRRTTLQKYLNSNPAVEFPRQVYIFDRIAAHTKSVVSFECATPYDLQGITVPKRQVIANGCP